MLQKINKVEQKAG